MNAQTLIDSTPSENFDFSKFWKSKSSKVNNNTNDLKGDKFVARSGNQIPASVPSEEVTSTSPSPHSLMPQTLNYTKLNNARRNLEWQQAEKELDLVIL